MGQPKMLLPWPGFSSILEAVVATYASAGLQEIVVVTGAEQARMHTLLAGMHASFPVRAVHNRAYQIGDMLASLQVGLAGLSPGTESALVGLGDQPQLAPQTVSRLLALAETSPAPLIIPSFNHRRGHPWLVRRALWPGLIALQPPATARDFLHAHREQIAYLEADPSVLQDIDTPDDYKKFT